MLMNILIATSKCPVQGEEQTFTDAVKDLAKDFEIEVLAINGVPGPGCYNIAIRVQGAQAEQFGNALCGALGPIARWTTTQGNIEGFTYQH